MYLSDERICPVCMKYQFNSLDSKERCLVCGWINDFSQNSNPNNKDGANKQSLNEALKDYKKKTFPKECADKEYYKDYIYGSIIGGAIGDALGYPIEFCNEEYRDRTDEEFSAQNCWLLDVPELYSRRAPGNTCLSALKLHKRGAAYAEPYNKNDQCEGFVGLSLNSSKGCGGLMHVAPLGLCYKSVDPKILDKDGAEIAAITHSHSLGYMPAAVLTHILHSIVYRKYGITLEEIVIEARDSISQMFRDDKHIMELMDIIDLAIELSKNDKSDLENINRIGEGWAIVLLMKSGKRI